MLATVVCKSVTFGCSSGSSFKVSSVEEMCAITLLSHALARHSSHVIRHTSHVTRHTSSSAPTGAIRSSSKGMYEPPAALAPLFFCNILLMYFERAAAAPAGDGDSLSSLPGGGGDERAKTVVKVSVMVVALSVMVVALHSCTSRLMLL